MHCTQFGTTALGLDRYGSNRYRYNILADIFDDTDTHILAPTYRQPIPIPISRPADTDADTDMADTDIQLAVTDVSISVSAKYIG